MAQLVNSRLDAPAANQSHSDLCWAVWAICAAFGTYFCMYGFRKPFTAAAFGETSSLKDVFVATQLAGYMLSKFAGVKVIAEMPAHRRIATLLSLIGLAEFSLLLFGLIPSPLNAACLFFNGLALGMVFGLVLGFLEGRQLTEAMVAGLCASFILADGVTKSVGAWLLTRGISEYWMPAIAGLLFFPPLAFCTWMLSRIPPPHAQDIAARTERVPLNGDDRRNLLRQFRLGIAFLLVIYVGVTIVRSLRADYAREIWQALGQPASAKLFTQSELWVVLGVIVVNGLAASIRDNRAAFFCALATCAVGPGLIAFAVVGQQAKLLSGFAFMVLVGVGLYLPYVAIHTTVFERLLAMTRYRGNVGFLLYVADASGYCGYLATIGCLAVARLVAGQSALGFSRLNLFLAVCGLTSCVALLCAIGCWRYFALRSTDDATAALAEEAA